MQIIVTVLMGQKERSVLFQEGHNSYGNFPADRAGL
jgi:hypothetical protein